MRLENDMKLDYKDVLIRPKRHTSKSREVSLERTYTLLPQWSSYGQEIPIMAANMDGRTFGITMPWQNTNCLLAW